MREERKGFSSFPPLRKGGLLLLSSLKKGGGAPPFKKKGATAPRFLPCTHPTTLPRSSASRPTPPPSLARPPPGPPHHPPSLVRLPAHRLLSPALSTRIAHCCQPSSDKSWCIQHTRPAFASSTCGESWPTNSPGMAGVLVRGRRAPRSAVERRRSVPGGTGRCVCVCARARVRECGVPIVIRMGLGQGV
jgi:hypothetical protein